MFPAAAALVIILALGWWHSQRKADAATRAAKDADEVHGQDRAHEIAKLQSELSRVKGWTPTGS